MSYLYTFVYEKLISLLESLISLNHFIVIALVEYIWSINNMQLAMEVKQETMCG